MLLILDLLSRMWPTAEGRKWFKELASKIRREVYGGLSTRELMCFRSQLFHDMQHSVSTSKLHAETFKGFKGVFAGKSVVLVFIIRCFPDKSGIRLGLLWGTTLSPLL